MRGQARGLVVLLRGGAELARWPLVVDDRLDLGVVDELARMQLSARRMGCSVRLLDACPDLVRLLALVGLAGVVPVGPVGLEVGGESEDGEQTGVEEVVVPDDPVA